MSNKRPRWFSPAARNIRVIHHLLSGRKNKSPRETESHQNTHSYAALKSLCSCRTVRYTYLLKKSKDSFTLRSAKRSASLGTAEWADYNEPTPWAQRCRWIELPCTNSEISPRCNKGKVRERAKWIESCGLVGCTGVHSEWECSCPFLLFIILLYAGDKRCSCPMN